ncbi:epoxide hydrolase [Aspergillus sclerotialis]|uniref:Epoxide hydrolase n=1 Tax=Aspergillus sclerotialis TaxID=2070753 RepID=A0A3A2ZVK3_9EURO|nr:epoxide hydrolase [Aspergillus sclerotialis]
MASIKPFKINTPDSDIQTLHQKLDLATFPDELDEAGWDMGCPLSEIKRLTALWKDGFDWREKERQLNEQLPQFTTPVPVSGFGQLDIHFIHQRNEVPGAIPLLFVHGWPGSFLEAIKLIPLLTKGAESQPAFHLVVPSLPNFGFSQGVKQRGFGLTQYAEAMHGVMMALGYEEYVTQGGDWGAIITRVMAKRYPQHIKAAHFNFFPMTPPYPWKSPIVFLHHHPRLRCQGKRYMKQQETRPQTLGYALHDSPVALLAWIYDKLHSWSDDYPWTDEEILTWVSIYQFSTPGPAASVRIYYEASKGDGPGGETTIQAISSVLPSSVKLAVAHFKNELIKLPFFWYRAVGNIVKESEYEVGGHFAAFEVPELLAGDLRSFFGRNGQAYGVIAGKDGY